MKIKLYESWGVLAHEKQPVYTVNCPVSDAYNLVEVELPHVTGANDYGELLITLDGTQYHIDVTWGDQYGRTDLRYFGMSEEQSAQVTSLIM